MDSNNEHSMAEAIASWAQKIIGPLVVAALLGLFGAGLFTRDAVHSINSRVASLEKRADKTDGDRYRKADGNLERITRATSDRVHDDKMRELDKENIRIWSAIRKHLEKGEHQGADYRLKTLEKHLEKNHEFR